MFLYIFLVNCVSLNFLSQYNYGNMTGTTAAGTASGPLGEKAVIAMWQLALALIFKIVTTIFTFGLKVFCILWNSFDSLILAKMISAVTSRNRGLD